MLARQAAYRDFFPRDYLDSLTVEYGAEIWTNRLQAPGSTCLVAEDGSVIVGQVRFGPAEEVESVGEVYQLHIDPDYWRRAIGSTLLKEAERRLADHGFDRAVLNVYEANSNARAFYERLGWRFDGTTTDAERGGALIRQLGYAKDLRRDDGDQESNA